jgi:membrane carboxypeptidase/penicillin-binding protein
MITDMLSDVIKRGTASRAKASFSKVAIAGKTGTSRDGWFVGYTPNLVCAVWVGLDDNEQLGMTGAEAALPAWVDFMKDALAIRPSLGGASFPKPGGILTVRVDPESGALAGPDCPASQVVSVANRFAPVIECYLHMPSTDSEISISDSGMDISSDTDALNTEQESEEISQPDQMNRESPAAAEDTPDDPVEPQSKPIRRTTRIELDERGQTRLVSDQTMAKGNNGKPPTARKGFASKPE